MWNHSFSFCPFRVQTNDHQAGCTLQLSTTIRCYTQELRPLLRDNDFFQCPQTGIKIDLKTSNQLEFLLTPLLRVQDEFEIAINIWPTVKGIASPLSRVESSVGADMVKIAKEIRNSITEIILVLE